MALTRNFLKSTGLTEEQVDAVIEAHRETINGITADRDKFKVEADKVDKLNDKIAELKSEIAKHSDYDELKSKYDKKCKEFEDFKADITAKGIHQTKADAYAELLREIGVSEKRISSIVKITDVDGYELGSDGKLTDIDNLRESAKTEWADFIAVGGERGANVPNPPTNQRMNKADFNKLTLSEQMKFANENPEVYEALFKS